MGSVGRSPHWGPEANNDEADDIFLFQRLISLRKDHIFFVKFRLHGEHGSTSAPYDNGQMSEGRNWRHFLISEINFLIKWFYIGLNLGNLDYMASVWWGYVTHSHFSRIFKVGRRTLHVSCRGLGYRAKWLSKFYRNVHLPYKPNRTITFLLWRELVVAARWPKSFIHFILLAIIIDNRFLCYQKVISIRGVNHGKLGVATPRFWAVSGSRNIISYHV